MKKLFISFLTVLSLYGFYYLNPQLFFSFLGSIFLPLLMLLGLFFILKRHSSSPQSSIIPKTIPKTKYTPITSVIKFSDIAGIDEIKLELEEIVCFIQNSERYEALGARLPKGILLSGPPGVGKTLLAKAIAGEAGIPFFNTSGSEFVEFFVGAGASKIRSLFTEARVHEKAIIFIDEIDAVGKSRGSGGFAGANDEREQTLNQLLVEMDGFSGNGKIIVIAATNRSQTLDEALLRAGRFDRQIAVNLPSSKSRSAILSLYAQKSCLSADVNLDDLAKRTTGFSGADLANLINEAAIVAVREDAADEITQKHLDAALLRINAGLPDNSKKLNDATKSRVAFHEVGHAIVSASFQNNVETISILPRTSGALGFTISNSEEDVYLMTKNDVIERIAILMAGYAAEEINFGSASNGASDDLRRATELARLACTEWGFGDRLINKSFLERPKFVDQDILSFIELGLDKAKSIILGKLDILKSLSQRLITEETITFDTNLLLSI